LLAHGCCGLAVALLDPRRPVWTLICLGLVVSIRALAILFFGMLSAIFGKIAFSMDLALWSSLATAIGCGVGWWMARSIASRRVPLSSSR
jgi:hypothetical protein